MRSVYRLVVADGHVLFRQGVQALLRDYPDLEVVGQAANGLEAVQTSRALRPDIVLVDAQLPFPQVTSHPLRSGPPDGLLGRSRGLFGQESEPWEDYQGGLETTRRLRGELPETKVILLAALTEHSELVYEAIRAGAMGFVTKSSEVGELVTAIRSVARGHAGITGGSLTNLLMVLGEQNLSGQDRHDSLEKSLSDREEEVLDLVAQGHSNREIALALFISESTVRSHLHSILDKLQLSNRVQAATYALTRRKRRAPSVSSTPRTDLQDVASMARSIGSPLQGLSHASGLTKGSPISRNRRLDGRLSPAS